MTLNILSFLFFSISVLSPLFYFNVYVLFFAKEHSMFLLSNSASFIPTSLVNIYNYIAFVVIPSMPWKHKCSEEEIISLAEFMISSVNYKF